MKLLEMVKDIKIKHSVYPPPPHPSKKALHAERNLFGQICGVVLHGDYLFSFPVVDPDLGWGIDILFEKLTPQIRG